MHMDFVALYEWLAARGSASTREAADHFRVTTDVAGDALARGYRMRYLLREREGGTFRYQPNPESRAPERVMFRLRPMEA